MNKHLLWVIPVGVAAGLSLPLFVPVRKKPTPIAPPPPVPIVAIEGFELKPLKPAQPAPQTFVVEESSNLGSFASAPMPLNRVEARRRLRLKRKLDAKSMRRIQLEDSRAWQAADRLLQYERRGE